MGLSRINSSDSLPKTREHMIEERAVNQICHVPVYAWIPRFASFFRDSLIVVAELATLSRSMALV